MKVIKTIQNLVDENGREYEIRITDTGREIKAYTDVLKRQKEQQEKEWDLLRYALKNPLK